jgi:hypothetical protein
MRQFEQDWWSWAAESPAPCTTSTPATSGCDVLYYDPTPIGQARRNPAGHPSASDGWQPCTAPGQAWTDPDLVLRWICTRHRHQLVALHAAGRADQIR